MVFVVLGFIFLFFLFKLLCTFFLPRCLPSAFSSLLALVGSKTMTLFSTSTFLFLLLFWHAKCRKWFIFIIFIVDGELLLGGKDRSLVFTVSYRIILKVLLESFIYFLFVWSLLFVLYQLPRSNLVLLKTLYFFCALYFLLLLLYVVCVSCWQTIPSRKT